MQLTIAGNLDTQVTFPSSGFYVHQFNQAGLVELSVQTQDRLGNVLTATVTIKVISAESTAFIALEGVERSWQWPNLPAEVVVETGDYKYHAASKKMACYDEYDQGYIIARLGANGPILASFKPEVFTIYNVVKGYVSIVETHADGSSVIEDTLYLSKMPNNLVITLNINTGGAIFGNGSLQYDIPMGDFNDLNSYTYRVLRPAGKTTSCHNPIVKDGILVLKYL